MAREPLQSPPRLSGEQEEDLRSLTEYLGDIYRNIQIDTELNLTLDMLEADIINNGLAIVGVADTLSDVAKLEMTANPTYLAAQVQDIADKIDEIIDAFTLTAPP